MSNTSKKKTTRSRKKTTTKKATTKVADTPKVEKNLDGILEEAITNIRADRAVTANLLTELMLHMKTQGEHTHENLGTIASKYVETLQRSNEQLVKISSIIQKKESKSDGLSNSEREETYDLLKEG